MQICIFVQTVHYLQGFTFSWLQICKSIISQKIDDPNLILLIHTHYVIKLEFCIYFLLSSRLLYRSFFMLSCYGSWKNAIQHMNNKYIRVND